MQDVIKKVIVSKEEMNKVVKNLAKMISEDYKDKEVILLGVLKGGFMFLADLVRELTIDVKIDFISVSSYGASTKSSGVVRIIKDTEFDITDKHVLLIEDIVDTGLTLHHLKDMLFTRNPKSLKVCAPLDKPSRRKIDIEAEYKGIEIEDVFVVGYGLDYKNLYRNLPDVCELKPEVYVN